MKKKPYIFKKSDAVAQSDPVCNMYAEQDGFREHKDKNKALKKGKDVANKKG